MQEAIVIGAGIAGIAASIRLAVKGYNVNVYEANDYPGGKMTSINVGDFRFDAGPSLFTLPGLVTELFELCGDEPEEYFKYDKKETICNYFWDDGYNYSMPSGRTEIIQGMANHFDVSESTIDSYLERSKVKYDLTNPIFIEKSLHKLSTYFSKETIVAFLNMLRLDLFSTLHGKNRKVFSDSKLIQIFDRFATYNGSSPYQTSGIMSMIPHLEMGLGTYFPEGGMKSISQSLYELAKRQGVKFHFSQFVEEILLEDKKALGVKINGEIIKSDVLISNMDIFSTYKKLLSKHRQPKKILDQERSSSALIFYWGVNGNHSKLDLHNILFSDSYKEEFNYIFEKKEIHKDPTIYINISSKCNDSDAPTNCENWFVMINTPSDTGQDWDAFISKSRKNIIEKIDKVLNIDLESLILEEDILDPRLIESRTSSHQGSLYGTSSNSQYSAFLRHPNFSRDISNLYFVGGSVHPGGGIPLCLNSAKIVSNLI